MKFSLTLLALGATVSASTTPTRVTVTKRVIESRDLATIQGVLGSVSASLSALNAAATAFAGAGDVAALDSASQALNDVLTSGASTVQGTDAISVNDAITLQATSADLQAVAQSLTDSLNAKKPEIQNAGACATVRASAATINTNSQTLIDAVVSKVPTEIQSVAAGIVSGFTGVLQQNTDNFAEGSCVDAAGAGGGATSPSSSSAPASSSAAASATNTASGPNTATASSRPTGNGTAAGGASPTSSPPVVTAGAGAMAVPIGMGLVFVGLLM